LANIEWAVAGRPFPGQTQSGDLHVVAPRPNGALIAAIDGLGHGSEAATAAVEAASVLTTAPADDIVELMRRCDGALRHTRGAVMSVAAIDHSDNSLTWGGIGNVNGVILRDDVRRGPPRQRLAPRPGIIGSGIARPTSERTNIYAGDVLVFATDGVTSSFADSLEADRSESAQRMANRIVEEYWAQRDDVLVLVARYRGA
jgi:negative regulator of sigma-B (phosphoserine phosphatase)